MDDDTLSAYRNHTNDAVSDDRQECEEQTSITCVDASSPPKVLNGDEEHENCFKTFNNEDSDHSYATDCKSGQKEVSKSTETSPNPKVLIGNEAQESCFSISDYGDV